MALFGRNKDKAQPDQPQQAQREAHRQSINDKIAMARQMQAAALQQMAAVQQATAGGAEVGSNTWFRQFASILAGPQPGYVKRCSCTVCGAPKKLPSVTAYVYCDYCGSLADYDLHRACESSTMPGPEYAKLVNGLQPQMKAARAAGQADQYRALQRQIFASYIANVPMAVSHRAKGDESYRDQLIAYMAESAVVRAFDAESTQLEQEMVQRVTALQWTGGLMDRKVAPETFWPMTDTLARQIEVDGALLRRAGVTDLDPDKADYLYGKMGWSGFCQGWLQYLTEDAAHELLTRNKLLNEYVPTQPEGADPRTCSGCGGQIHALPGAKVVVCDGCGKSLDVGSAAITCPGCGGSVTLPVGVSNVACPFCQGNVERVGII